MKDEITIDGVTYVRKEEQPEQPVGRWKPEEGGWYWYLDSELDIIIDDWHDDTRTDQKRFDWNNVFRTKEEAESRKKYLLAVAELERSTDFKPDWSEGYKNKWFVQYDHSDKCLTADWCDDEQVAQFYYPTEELAKQSIKDHKEAWLTYFGVDE